MRGKRDTHKQMIELVFFYVFKRVGVKDSTELRQSESHKSDQGPHLTQHFNGCGQLFFADFLVLLFLGGCLETLPWEAGPVEVHEDVAHALHVVPPAVNAQDISCESGHGIGYTHTAVHVIEL